MDTNADEIAILGGDDVAADASDSGGFPGGAPQATEAVTQPVVTAQPEQQTQTTEPTLPDSFNQTEIGKAFALQRQSLETKHQAEIELARRQAQDEVLQRLQQQQQQQAPQIPEMPDPTLEPEAFAEWLQARDRSQFERFEQTQQARLQQIGVQTSLQMAQMTINLQKDALGFDWNGAIEKANAEIQTVAPLMGIRPEAYIQQVLASPDAGERIMALAQANASRSATAAPVDVAAIEKAAYEKAFRDLQAKSAASPHSLAPRGLPPGQAVTPTVTLTEDEILAQ